MLAESSPGKAKVPLRIHLSQYVDETSARCDWHLPEAHYLESWSDARAYDGTASIVQPLVAPLYGGKSSHEIVAALSGEPQRSGHELVQDYWRGVWYGRNWIGGSQSLSLKFLMHGLIDDAERPLITVMGQMKMSDAARQMMMPDAARQRAQLEDGFARFWRAALNDGIVAGTAQPSFKLPLMRERVAQLQKAGHTATGASGLEILFRPDPTLFDGRLANNGWLQELPKPLSRLTWDNAVLLSPATAERLGLSFAPSGHGGEHGETTVDVVEIRYRGATLEAPVWAMPGQPDDCVTVFFGQGRTMAGSVGNGVGYNGYALRTSAAPWFDSGAEIRKTGKRFPLACVQYHHEMAGRELVRSGTVQENPQGRRSISVGKRSEGDAGPAGPGEPARQPSLYRESDYPYDGYKWGMAIDLTACTGCGACVAACQAENNSPVVGKEQVQRGREMHWIRIDRYFEGGDENPKTVFQPVPCMQCENAPCELVCPVAATAHSAEGLNDMVYNRCVGTRYCSNNCPYKVRRFNFLHFADYGTPSLKLMRNPAVTVRSRGVMEKCTYCVQRITEARIRADREDRTLRDGEVATACQAACPAGAIAFGNLNDPQSQVSKWKSLEVHYALLADLNTRPRTTYLAELEESQPRDQAIVGCALA